MLQGLACCYQSSDLRPITSATSPHAVLTLPGNSTSTDKAEPTAAQLPSQGTRSPDTEPLDLRAAARPFPGFSSLKAGGVATARRSTDATLQLLCSERLTQPRDHVINVEGPHWWVLPRRTRGASSHNGPFPYHLPRRTHAPSLALAFGECPAQASLNVDRSSYATIM